MKEALDTLSPDDEKLLRELAKGLKSVQKRRGAELKVYAGLDMTGL